MRLFWLLLYQVIEWLPFQMQHPWILEPLWAPLGDIVGHTFSCDQLGALGKVSLSVWCCSLIYVNAGHFPFISDDLLSCLLSLARRTSETVDPCLFLLVCAPLPPSSTSFRLQAACVIALSLFTLLIVRKHVHKEKTPLT